MLNMLTIAEWAATRQMSRQAGYQAVKRCSIPVDLDGKVDQAQADRLYRERTQRRYRPPEQRRHAVVPAARPVDLLELAHDLAAIMASDDGVLMDEGIEHLLAVLHRLTVDELQALQLPLSVARAVELWAATEGET